MNIVRSSFTTTETEKELLKYRRQVSKLYKEGHGLEELCREFRLDISSILFLLRKSKLKKKKLYIIYENQAERVEGIKNKNDEKERRHIEKFFPHTDSFGLSGNYYGYWINQYKKQQTKKDSCKHTTRHIRCGRCNKILADATNISIQI